MTCRLCNQRYSPQRSFYQDKQHCDNCVEKLAEAHADALNEGAYMTRRGVVR